MPTSFWTPHPGQRDFLENSAKIKVLACGRRWGKTDACAAAVVDSLFQPSPRRHVLIAPTLDQATLLFDRVEAQLLDRIGPDADEKPKVRRSPFPRLDWNGHRVIARSGHLGRSLRGNEATDIVVDEAAYLPEALITEVALPMLATTNGRLILISTPHGLNHFWRFFKMGETGEHGVWSRHAPSEESPFVSREFLEIQKGLISERAFRVEYGAEFLDSSGRVFRTEAIDACLVAEFDSPIAPPFSIGIDWGKYEDYTAVAVVAGHRPASRLVALERFNKDTWANMVERVREIVRRFPGARITADGTAAGDALNEQFKEGLTGYRIESEVFTHAKKHAAIDNLAWIIENAALKMEPCPDLMRELQHFEAKTSPSGNRILGAIGGTHDDLVIALALACKGLPRGPSGSLQAGAERRFSKVRNEVDSVRFSV